MSSKWYAALKMQAQAATGKIKGWMGNNQYKSGPTVCFY